MPIEIKELHIKTVIGASPGQDTQQNAGRNGANTDMDQIIAVCVEQVLEILTNKKER